MNRWESERWARAEEERWARERRDLADEALAQGLRERPTPARLHPEVAIEAPGYSRRTMHARPEDVTAEFEGRTYRLVPDRDADEIDEGTDRLAADLLDALSPVCGACGDPPYDYDDLLTPASVLACQGYRKL